MLGVLMIVDTGESSLVVKFCCSVDNRLLSDGGCWRVVFVVVQRKRDHIRAASIESNDLVVSTTSILLLIIIAATVVTTATTKVQWGGRTRVIIILR
jgi:hypothetical protein